MYYYYYYLNSIIFYIHINEIFFKFRSRLTEQQLAEVQATLGDVKQINNSKHEDAIKQAEIRASSTLDLSERKLQLVPREEFTAAEASGLYIHFATI